MVTTASKPKHFRARFIALAYAENGTSSAFDRFCNILVAAFSKNREKPMSPFADGFNDFCFEAVIARWFKTGQETITDPRGRLFLGRLAGANSDHWRFMIAYPLSGHTNKIAVVVHG